MSFTDVKFENLSTDGSNANKISPVPKQICDYWIANGYKEKGIPLNADTANEIAKILNMEEFKT